MRTKALLCAVVLCGVASCGAVNSPKADANGADVAASDFSLAVDQNAFSLAIAGSTTVNVTVTRGSGFTDAVELTATGLPTGVTATFAESSLPQGTDTTAMTLTVDKTADAGTSTITISGKAGALEHTSDVALELHTSTIMGKVRGNTANLTVRIVGKAAVQSDATGNFTFTDVKLPYDIYVISQTGPSNAPVPALNYYKDLTHLTPQLYRPTTYCVGVACNLLALGTSGRVTGSRLGAGNNTDPLYVAWSTGGTDVSTGSWDFTATWGLFNPPASTAGTLHVLQATRNPQNVPTGYFYGTAGATINNTATMNNVNVTLAALNTTAALSGTVTVPAGFSAPTLTLSQQVSGRPFEIWTAANTANAASLIPLLTDQKASLHATATASGGRTVEAVFPALAAATDVSMTLPAPAGMTGPVNGATNITNTTPFEYTTSANQIYLTTFSNSTATYFVYSTSGSITIPDVPEMPRPSAASYTWTVKGYGPHPNIDAVVDTAGVEEVGKLDSDGSWHSVTTNPTRTFTTQ